jgi:hypothetical protein
MMRLPNQQIIDWNVAIPDRQVVDQNVGMVRLADRQLLDWNVGALRPVIGRNHVLGNRLSDQPVILKGQKLSGDDTPSGSTPVFFDTLREVPYASMGVHRPYYSSPTQEPRHIKPRNRDHSTDPDLDKAYMSQGCDGRNAYSSRRAEPVTHYGWVTVTFNDGRTETYHPLKIDRLFLEKMHRPCVHLQLYIEYV